MRNNVAKIGCLAVLLLAGLTGISPTGAQAAATTLIPGATGTTFNLVAMADSISTSDGDSMFMWGYALGSGRMQYPGPTLIVNQGAAITVTLQNQLPVPVSIVFPGQSVTATGGTPGTLTQEVPAAPTPGVTGPTTVTYTFTPLQPGTYIYYSGTRSDLEVEMGLVGTIIVRPAGFSAAAPQAYADAATSGFTREYLFVLTEADPVIHQKVGLANNNINIINLVDMTSRHATDWFENGRNFPDTMADQNVAWLPTQPYNAMPLMHPGEKVLIRMVSAGVDLHPFHTHGQNHVIIARDGMLLKTAASSFENLGVSDYTTTSIPGDTVDAIWGPWYGSRLGWDVYGTADVNPHTCSGSAVVGPGGPTSANFDPVTHEYCPDHYKAIPVALPCESCITYGPFSMYGGTPFLGVPADKTPQNPGTLPALNTVGGISFMWHSHAERELTTNDIFIGGMATMSMVVPLSTNIP